MVRFNKLVAAAIAGLSLVAGIAGPLGAQTAPPTPGGLVLVDFETDLGDRLSTYAGPASSIKTTIVEQAVQGRYALRIDSVLKDWNGVVVQPPKDQVFDWSSFRALSLWVFGTNSGQMFVVELNDKGEEHFRSPLITDDFTGWKQIVIPFEEFASRQDWQPENADIDLDITWPIKDFQPFASVGGAGYILIDLIEVIP